MTFTTAPLRTAAAAVCAREGADVTGLARLELLELMREVAAVRRAADVLLALGAAEVDRRSRLEDGHAGLAAREGYRSARALIAATTGGSMAEAQRLVDTGSLLADDAVSADAQSPVCEVKNRLAELLSAGSIGVEVASMFTRALAEVPDTEHTRDVFLKAVAKVPGLAAHQARNLVWRAQAFADPEAWERREDHQYEARSVTLRDDADGMVLLTARLTPLMAAPIKAVLDAGVRRAMQDRRDDPDSDPRSAWQMRADLFTDAFKHLLDCDRPTSGVKTTVVVRMTLEQLQKGLGVGEIDGFAQPVSAGALRRAAADAEIIPQVLGSDSEILDQGRARRLFTPAQRLALGERDGGCARCHAPPSWCEAHHIKWWNTHDGTSDLANGVLLCTRCHHLVHRDGWEVEVRPDPDHGNRGNGTTVWFTPPRAVDPTQTPRLGGRARFDLTQREIANREVTAPELVSA